MAARIAGGIVALIAGALLIWVMIISFGPEESWRRPSTSPPMRPAHARTQSGAAAASNIPCDRRANGGAANRPAQASASESSPPAPS